MVIAAIEQASAKKRRGGSSSNASDVQHIVGLSGGHATFDLGAGAMGSPQRHVQVEARLRAVRHVMQARMNVWFGHESEQPGKAKKRPRGQKRDRTICFFITPTGAGRFDLTLSYNIAEIHSSFSVASGGSTVETLAMSAFVFAARMPEGHAIVVRTIPSIEAFRVCDGATTASGAVPRNWLPTIAWYEHDDDFSFGIAYVTQDAYESPRARFGFVAATVEPATRADYETYSRNGPKNLLPEYLSDALSHHDSPDLPNPIPPEILQNPRKAWPFASRPLCRYARIFRLDEAQKAKARQVRPSNGSRYWHEVPRGDDTIRLTDNQYPNKYELLSPTDSPERVDRHQLVFPIRISEGLAEVDAKTSDHEYYDHELLLGDPTLAGFAYCDSLASDSGDLMNALAGKPVQRLLPIRCRIGEVILSRAFNCDNDTVQPIHDDDRFGIMVEYILL